MKSSAFRRQAGPPTRSEAPFSNFEFHSPAAAGGESIALESVPRVGMRLAMFPCMTARRVLVVDDDPDSRMLMEHVLTFEGYAVTTADNGREALDRLSVVTPSVILLDLEMPVMDGRSFRQHQLQMPGPVRSVPVIVCSGSDQANQLTNELHPFACLPKPLPDFGPLLEHVEAACQQST
jgi:CheY-like chemotaxis protein